MKTWEELTPLEQAAATYWDMYKDAHGVRPRGIDTSNWTLEDFDREFEYLSKVIDSEEALRREAEAVAVKEFENCVTRMILTGAGDRETALRWLMQASDAGGDWEYFCYLNGLPYGYFRTESVA